MRKQDNPSRPKIRFKPRTKNKKTTKNINATKMKENKQGRIKDVGITRIPRPSGLTLLAQQTRNQQPDINLVQKILSYTLAQPIQLNNKPVTIQTLASYLNISKTIVMKAYIDYQAKMSKVMLGNGSDVGGALLFLGLEKILENEAIGSQQLQLLQASQGNGYKAYISSSVNEAINLKMKATEAILGLYKAIRPQGPTSLIQNNFGPNSANPNEAIKAIGMAEALQILNEKGLTKIDHNPQSHQHLIPIHSLENVPEVRANYMDASNTDGMALVAKLNTNDEEIKDNKSHHRNRRSIEEGLDEENFA